MSKLNVVILVERQLIIDFSENKPKAHFPPEEHILFIGWSSYHWETIELGQHLGKSQKFWKVLVGFIFFFSAE